MAAKSRFRAAQGGSTTPSRSATRTTASARSGPILITDADGAIIEDTDVVFTGAFDVPRAAANLGYAFTEDVAANLNLSLERTFFRRLEAETRRFPDGRTVLRDNLQTGGSPEYEIGADIAFPLGTGRLKLIALEAYDADVSGSEVVDRPTDGTGPTGSRFASTGGSGERIARAEYSWPMWGATWQASAEAAFNRLDRISRLFTLDDRGSFTGVPFPGGSGGVTEDRYEGTLSLSRPLTGNLALQATLGAEYSQLRQTGVAANTRSFQRPKGSVSLGWQPGDGFDISIELLREVGQLSFGDFLAQVFLDEGNADAGNNELVPSQSWGVDIEVNKTLGALGSTTLTIQRRWIEDFIDVIPLAGGGESRGNIDSARQLEVELTTTLRLDTLGVPGGQLDVEIELFESSVRDPLDQLLRPFSGARDRQLELDYRHDIPRTDYAYGASLRYDRRLPRFRLGEISRNFEGPTFLTLFAEHKDVAGLTIRASAANLLGGRERGIRTVFDGPRTDGAIAFVEDRDLRIGPIFRLSVSGNF